MMAKPMKSLELHNPMIQCLIKIDTTQKSNPYVNIRNTELQKYIFTSVPLIIILL